MKVAIDVSKMHRFSKDRGIGIYAQNLYESLKKHTDIDIKLLDTETSYEDFDLIHFPFFDLYKTTLPFKIKKPFIVTIPDLVPLQFSAHYPPGIKGKINLLLQKLTIKKAKSIIAISETVKKDINKLLKIDSKKIFVTYLAPGNRYDFDKKIVELVKSKYKLPESFVLYIGNVNWNKNILNTAEACIRAKKHLVIIGSSFLDKSDINHPEKRNLKIFLNKYADNGLIKLIGSVSSEELTAIMNLATVMIFISFYEGFGLPILEAQASSLPVITSNISAMPEVAGEGALLVDPNNMDEIVKSLGLLFNSVNLRQKLIKKGKDNLIRFSWKKTAEQTLEVYKRSLNIES